jgi:hypothetical protein
MKGEYIMQEIQIKNFRSLKDTGLQKLSPITLLVGENSSGKSSFLRSFPLIKQSISKRTAGPILWAGDVDDYVDFGSFEETVTNDSSDTISFRYRFCIRGLGRLHRYLALEDLLDEAQEPLDSIDYEITISSIKGQDQVSKFSLHVNSMHADFDFINKCVLIDEKHLFSGLDHLTTEEKLNPNPISRYYFSSQSKAFNFALLKADALWSKLFSTVSASKDEFFSPSSLFSAILDIGSLLSHNQAVSPLANKDDLSPDIFDTHANYYNIIANEIAHNNDLQGLVKLCYIYSIFSDIDEYIVGYFKQVHYIAPLRATAERYYRLRNLAVDEVDYQGKNLAIFINSLTSKQLKEFHAWTNEHFGFSVRTNKSKGHLSLIIQLRGSEKVANLSDTGFGYSQLLPIITQLWELSSRKPSKSASSYSPKQLIPLIVAIEQPELHLHPAVQAKLAKAFIASIDLAKKNGYQLQLLLETHSETIVNYLGRSIARGKLSRDDVSVILFEKQSNTDTTFVKNTGFDQDGYLLNWPYGFFDPEE